MDLDANALTAVLREEYGLTITSVAQLSGFYDANFRIDTTAGSFFVKVYGHDPLPVVLFQIDLINTLYGAGLPVGRLCLTKAGASYFVFNDMVGIVQTFLPGRHLADAPKTESLFHNLGETLGRIHASTDGKRFAGEAWKVYPWDLKQFDLPVSHMSGVEKFLNTKTRAACQLVIEEWKRSTAQFDHLRTGVIHNDFHNKNVLVERDHVVGITDFGDSMRSWFAADVATAIAHFDFDDPQVLNFIKIFLSGYESAFILTDDEKVLLPLLIKMRAVVVLIEIPKHFAEQRTPLYEQFFTDAARVLEVDMRSVIA